ncbi:MAG: hypothetical protein HY275_07120 [Gemmatimonadetes bacterium]|nr:hypothetical protein [Gemmatimonadota bacterium]
MRQLAAIARPPRASLVPDLLRIAAVSAIALLLAACDVHEPTGPVQRVPQSLVAPASAAAAPVVTPRVAR